MADIEKTKKLCTRETSLTSNGGGGGVIAILMNTTIDDDGGGGMVLYGISFLTRWNDADYQCKYLWA